MSKKINILFIGQNNPLAHAVLDALHQHHHVVGIARSRKKPATKLNSSHLLRKKAKAWQTPFFELSADKNAEFVQFIHSVKPDLICVASMAQLLEKEAFMIPRLGAINVHPSILPNYRGPNPFFWVYQQTEKESGVTVHLIDEGVDTGNIICVEKYKIELGMRFKEMFKVASECASVAVVVAIEKMMRGELGQEQRHLDCPIRARRISREEARELVDGSWPIEKIWHLLRGMERRYKLLPRPHGWQKHFNWIIEDYKRQPIHQTKGNLIEKIGGKYQLRHQEGTIRLRVQYSLRGFKALLKELLNLT